MKITMIVVVVVFVIISIDILRTVYLFYVKSKSLVVHAVPFNRTISSPEMRILVLGDSTAYGTGAESPEKSTAGRLGVLYPTAEIVNFSVNGLRIAGLLKNLESIKKDEHFDIVLIQIGANDIIRMTSLEDIQTGIHAILSRAQLFGGKVIVLHSGDVGDAKFFPWFVRPLFSKRSCEVREIYKKEVAGKEVSYVDLISSPISQMLRENPRRYYASDWLHLSGDGYGLWMQEIQKFLP